MIQEKEKLSLIKNMTNRHEDTHGDTETETTNKNKLNNNNNHEINGNKKKTSPNRSLDLPKYGAIRKQISPEKFIIDSPIADLPTPVNEDAETTEFWSKLRCGSLRTEELAEREKQKQERAKNRASRQSANYPGLAFGSAMFGSDTTMKFNIIKNELHNIMRSQLKRVDGEMNAFSSRVKEFDKHLEESEAYIRTATTALAEVVALQAEDDKSKNEDTENESNLSAFDQHVLFLETQLREAKMKASQSFQILEDCDQAQESLFSPSSTPSDPNVTAAATLSKSSNLITAQQALNVANGNVDLHNAANGKVELQKVANENVDSCTHAQRLNFANGNEDSPSTRVNAASSQTFTKEMEENIANGNVGNDITNGNITHSPTVTINEPGHQRAENIKNGNVESNDNMDIVNSLQVENSKNIHSNEGSSMNNSNKLNNGNDNCFKALLRSEDSANANLPL